MQPTDQQHRVLGRLVLALRAERLLDGARDIGYRVDDRLDAIVVDWTAGPHPREVAAGLAGWSTRDGDTAAVTVEAARASVVTTDRHAALDFDGTRVVLSTYDSVGMQHARVEYARNPFFDPHRPLRRIWPSPLEDDGAWLDSVLWDRDHQHSLVTTVVRAPIDLHRDLDWNESGYGVALDDEDMPATVGADRRQKISQFRRSGCSILPRSARNRSVDEADDWMTTTLDTAWSAPSFGGRAVTRPARHAARVRAAPGRHLRRPAANRGPVAARPVGPTQRAHRRPPEPGTTLPPQGPRVRRAVHDREPHDRLHLGHALTPLHRPSAPHHRTGVPGRDRQAVEMVRPRVFSPTTSARVQRRFTGAPGAHPVA